MSHFKEDRSGAPPDPTQKTLTNFIVSEDASRKVMDNHSSLGSDISDACIVNDDETSLSIGTNNTSSCDRDTLDCNFSSKLGDSNFTFSNDADQIEKFQKTANEVYKRPANGLCYLYQHNLKQRPSVLSRVQIVDVAIKWFLQFTCIISYAWVK